MMRGKTLDQLIAEAQANIGHISAEALKTAIENKEPIVLLDVRDPELYESEHLPGAISLPRAGIELEINELVPNQDAQIVTYCGGKTRGTLSAHTLRLMGYEKASVLTGGFRGWKAAGLPTEGEKSAEPENQKREK